MKKTYFIVFLTSLAAYLSVSWTLGVQHCDASWNESVLFFVLTFLFLRKHAHALPVTLSVIAGRLFFDIVVTASVWVAGGGIEPLWSWYMALMSVAGAVAAAVYYKWQQTSVLVAVTAVAVVLNTLVQPLWVELVRNLTLNNV